MTSQTPTRITWPVEGHHGHMEKVLRDAYGIQRPLQERGTNLSRGLHIHRKGMVGTACMWSILYVVHCTTYSVRMYYMSMIVFVVHYSTYSVHVYVCICVCECVLVDVVCMYECERVCECVYACICVCASTLICVWFDNVWVLCWGGIGKWSWLGGLVVSYRGMIIISLDIFDVYF